MRLVPIPPNVVVSRSTTDAGRTTSAYYESRLREWRRSNRWPFAIALAIAGLAATPVGIYVPHGGFYAGMIVGAVWGMIVWIRDDPPETIAKWKRGADGERETAKALRRLQADGWFAVHDRAGERGNLDHVVVGPAGIFLLETKNYSGTISVEGSELVASYGPAEIDKFTNRYLARSMRARAVRLKEQVQRVTDVREFVRAVVVIWGDFPAGCVAGDRVTYVAGDRLAAWLGSLEPRLCPRDANFIRLALAAEAIAPPAAPFGATA